MNFYIDDKAVADRRSATPTAFVPLCVFFAVFVSAIITGCTTDFEDLNTNPNAPTDVSPELLLRQVIYDYADHMSFEGFTGGANLGQYFSADPGFNRFDRGDLLAPQFGSNPWPRLYTNLRDIEIVLEKSRASEQAAVYEGPALVLRTLIAANLTDIFGDVPYTRAVAGAEGEVAPAYDEQEDIYLGPEGIFASLAAAIEVMEAYDGPIALAGDELFAGDLGGWIRFANSLRLRYALRASDAADASALPDVQAIVDGGAYIQTREEDAAFRFGGAPNDFGFARARVGDFNNYLMAETIDSVADALEDPREELWFREAANGGFNGIDNGIPTEDFTYDGGDVSFPGTIWRENSTQLSFAFMTSWETAFVIAELAQRGLVAADAEEVYEQGVRDAFAYWGVALPDDYLGRTGVVYDGTLTPIRTQRWLASIGQGYEGWIGWRRTGLPEFRTPLASLNDGRIPIRFPYPVDEQALNTEAYEEAIDRIGGENSANVGVWWQP